MPVVKSFLTACTLLLSISALANQASQLSQHYRQQALPQGAQFDFLIGQWRADVTRFNPADGGIALQYKGKWTARYQHDKRIVMDEFIRYTHAGEVFGSNITLRTFVPEQQHWQMLTLDANSAALTDQFTARWQNGEMLLSAQGAAGYLQGRFFEISPSHFRWQVDISRDGKTWVRYMELSAQRQ